MHRRDARGQEAGLTLVELLVVVLVLAILAAIALPAFLGQTDTARDAEARSIVSAVYKKVESCYAETEDFSQCETGDPELQDLDFGVGTATGEVRVVAFGRAEYGVGSNSRTGVYFAIWRRMPDAPEWCDRTASTCRNNRW